MIPFLVEERSVRHIVNALKIVSAEFSAKDLLSPSSAILRSLAVKSGRLSRVIVSLARQEQKYTVAGSTKTP